MWVKLWVRGGAGEEVKYLLVHDSYRADEEELKEMAREWARHTCTGETRDSYGYGWEEVTVLPDRVRDEMRQECVDSILSAKARLAALEAVPTVLACRHFACTNVATKEATIVRGMNAVDAEPTPLCESCYSSNESRRKSYERLRLKAQSV